MSCCFELLSLFKRLSIQQLRDGSGGYRRHLVRELTQMGTNQAGTLQAIGNS